jgi:NAD(P)H dehydrogenase (quinone)
LGSIARKVVDFMRYFVTGAAGHLGTALVNRLAEKVPASDIQLGVYDIADETPFVGRGFEIGRIDYSDRNILTAAFYNEDVVIFIPAHDPDSYHAVRDLEHVIDASKRAGVKHIVTTGFIGDQANNPFARSAYYGYVSRRLAEFHSIGWTLVREGVFTRTVTRHLDQITRHKAITAPCRQGKISFISIDDIAEAIADIVTDMNLLKTGRTFTLTQTQPVTMEHVAQLLTSITGTKISYSPMDSDDFERRCNELASERARRKMALRQPPQTHAPDISEEHFIGGVSDIDRANGHGTIGHMLASECEAAARGMLAETSTDFRTITGHDPRSLEDCLSHEFDSMKVSTPASANQ